MDNEEVTEYEDEVPTLEDIAEEADLDLSIPEERAEAERLMAEVMAEESPGMFAHSALHDDEGDDSEDDGAYMSLQEVLEEDAPELDALPADDDAFYNLLRQHGIKFVETEPQPPKPPGARVTPPPPKPRGDMTYEKFLVAIGNKCGDHVAKFESWDDMVTASSKELKKRKIPTRQRRWIRNWIHKYGQGLEPFDSTKKKYPRGYNYKLALQQQQQQQQHSQ